MFIQADRTSNRAMLLMSLAVLGAALGGGCGASGGGTSVGTYTGSGALVMTLSGKVEDGNGNPLPNYAVSIDNTQPVTTDNTGGYSINIPTIQIQAQNSIKVYNNNDQLAYDTTRPIDTEICVQTLQPIVIGPPTPPGLP